MSLGLTHIGALARGPAHPPTPAQPARDPVSLFQMSSQDRIRAETAMIVEATLLDLAAQSQRRAEVRPAGAFIDLRV